MERWTYHVSGYFQALVECDPLDRSLLFLSSRIARFASDASDVSNKKTSLKTLDFFLAYPKVLTFVSQYLQSLIHQSHLGS